MLGGQHWKLILNIVDVELCDDKAPSTTDNHWIWPHRPWQRVHVDYCGLFQGGSFLVIIDAKSKWLEVLPVSSKTAEATIDALRTVFAIHGFPEELATDNGAQCIAQEFKDFFRSNNNLCVKANFFNLQTKVAIDCLC